MSLFEDWKALTEVERSHQEHNAFWTAYFDMEKEGYQRILANHGQVLEGKLSALAGEFNMSETEFTGFLDGINTSLSESAELKLEALTSESDVKLEVEYEKLYFNMLNAKASWLYELDEWKPILSEEKRKEIAKAFRASKIFVADQSIGRNDPCPCGSGKKYKKCCGKAAV